MIDVAADMAAIVGASNEFGTTASIGGHTVDAIPLETFAPAQFGGLEVEGGITRLYVTQTALTAAGGAQGSAVTYNATSYTIARLEKMPGGLVRVELQR